MSSTTVRLTRRGQAVLVLLTMAVLVIVGTMFGHGSSQAAPSSGSGQAVRTLTVQPGESLWSVAARIAPHQDPRLVVAKLESMNRLPSGQVIAGQRLYLPSFG